jgi:hypothetical protein
MDTIQTTGLTVDDARSIFETAGSLQREGIEKEPLHTAIQMKLKEKNIIPDEKEFMKDFG